MYATYMEVLHHDEYVFGIPQSEIGQYSLYGTFVTGGLFTERDWRVTFPLVTAKPPPYAACIFLGPAPSCF